MTRSSCTALPFAWRRHRPRTPGYRPPVVSNFADWSVEQSHIPTHIAARRHEISAKALAVLAHTLDAHIPMLGSDERQSGDARGECHFECHCTAEIRKRYRT